MTTMSSSGEESPLRRYYGSYLEIEVFDTSTEGVYVANLQLDDKWDHINSSSARILGGLCAKLLRGDVNYGLLLESVLSRIIEMLGSDIGSITARSEALENSTSTGEPYLLCLALGEKTAGTLSPGEYTTPNQSHPQGSKGIDGIFGHAIRTDKAIISNDLSHDPRAKKKLPDNHPQIKSFFGIPLRFQDITLGLLAVATCEGSNAESYTTHSIQKILPLIDVCTRLLVKALDARETLASKIQRISTVDDAKDRFLATMSHELRTPLNGVLGMVTLLPDAGPLNDKQTEYVRNLTECTVELTSLLNNILDFSKMASDRLVLRKQPLIISDCVEDVVKMVEGNILAKGLRLHIRTPKELPVMMGDGQRLAQILTNLLGNAVKFTDIGSVDVDVSATALSETNIAGGRSGIMARKWKILFTVKDTGVGIPYDEQDKIFEVFHQSSSLSTYLSKSGTGLGLSIARELVRLMGGKISVASSGVAGKGSTFTFYIVLDEEIDVAGLTGSHADVLEGARILVVDDRPEMRLQISDMLFKWKCIPQAVSSAEEALQYLQYGMEFKLALVDICMPNMSGVELAQELRRKYPKLPLIGISSVELSSGEEYFDCYMYKPIDQNVLFPAVLGCLESPSRAASLPRKRTLKPRSRLKILVAEDDARNAYTMREMLVNLGYREKNIFTVENGEMCVNHARENTIDVVLMDIVMPIMDGLQASRLIKQLTDPPMIIAVSAAVQPSDKAKCQNAGIDGYLAKPLLREKLDAAISPLVRPSRKSSKKKKRAKGHPPTE